MTPLTRDFRTEDLRTSRTAIAYMIRMAREPLRSMIDLSGTAPAQ